MNQFETLLETLLAQDRVAVNHAFASEWAQCAKRGGIVLFGAGPMGNIALENLRRSGKEPLAFCDNNAALWNTRIAGIEVLSPGEAATRWSDAVFVVAIYNPSKATEQLRELGCECVVGAAVLWRAHGETFEPHQSFDAPDTIFEHHEEVRRAFALLADEESREEFLAQLQWRTQAGFAAMPAARSGKEIYFSPDLFTLNDADFFVDCGAFDGDTLRMVLDRRGEKFARFIGFEPDPKNFARFEKFVASLPESQRVKIEGRNAATGAQTGVVRFHADGTVGAGISDEGEIEAACVRLDDALENSTPTFIKMDIEGAEPEALDGARALLQRTRPILAICAYHATDHLWRIPLLIHDIHPDYKLVLRRYAEECWELVVYAVPPERAQS